MKSLLALPLVLLAGATLSAQSPDVFEVASLKPSAPGTRPTSKLDQAQFLCTAHTLLIFILSAYPDIEVQPWKLAGGPSWLNSDRWDLAAKLPPNVPAQQEILYRRTEQMLRTFLAEEFKLKAHREMRQTPVYFLTVAKSGSKLRQSESGELSINGAIGRRDFRHQSIAGLIQYVNNLYGSTYQIADRPLIDKTGLEGYFDFTLEWNNTPQLEADNAGPSIFAALEQQLGLKLQPEKAPLDFLVIDNAEKPVTGN